MKKNLQIHCSSSRPPALTRAKAEETMKLAAMITMAALAGNGAQAGAIAESANQTVTVCTQMGVDLEFHLARALATKVFAGIGVRLDWRNDQRSCPPGAISISLASSTQPGFHAGTLAFALPHEGTHVQIFYDRIRKMFQFPRRSFVLGHVLVHEITHILQGVNRHADRGIMKAQWDAKDFDHMDWRPLAYTEDDVRLIHLGLATRASRMAAILDAR
jgi:hypothetical protein